MLRISAQYSLATIFLKYQASGWEQEKPGISLVTCDLVEYLLLVAGGNAGMGWLRATLVRGMGRAWKGSSWQGRMLFW